MGDMFEWWWGGGDWYDWKQKERIESLEASHARTESALRSQLARQTSDLSGRIASLERALLALVQMEDTREHLAAFAEAGATRRYARQVITQLPGMGGDRAAGPPPEPPEADGYWLAPAARAIAAEVHQGPETALPLIEEARRRDRGRTDFLVVSLMGLIGAPERALDDLAGTLPSTDALTNAQRTVWEAVADGRFGAAGRTIAIDALRGAVGVAPGAEPDAERREQLGNALAAAIGGPSGDTPIDAGRRVAKLRAFVDGLTEQAAGSADAPAGNSDVVAAGDPLAEVMALLVNEGAPGEHEILVEMATIRQALADLGVPAVPTPMRWDAVTGSVWESLLADLTAVEEAAAGRRRLAFEVLAPWVVGVADTWAHRAAETPARSVRVDVRGTEFDVRADASAPVPRAEPVAPHPMPWMRPVAVVAGVATLAALVAGFAVAPVLLLVAVATGVAALLLWARDRAERLQVREAQRTRDLRLQQDTERLQQAWTTLRADLDEAGRLAAEAPGHVAAIAASLRAAAIG